MNPEPMKPGQARIVKGRTATWPSRVAPYWDCAPWGSGRVRIGGHGPGAVILNDQGYCLNLQSGNVYIDHRFVKGD